MTQALGDNQYEDQQSNLFYRLPKELQTFVLGDGSFQDYGTYCVDEETHMVSEVLMIRRCLSREILHYVVYKNKPLSVII